MADSPAKRHLQRVEAEEAAKRAAGGNLMEGTPIYQQTLLQLAQGRTLIVATHGPVLAARMDRVVPVQGAEVVV